MLITSTTKSSNNISSFLLRKLHSYLCKRNSIRNSILDLILILIHINLFTIGGNKSTSFQRNCKLRFLSNNLRNSTLIKNIIHKNILMNRESHTNNRIIRTDISILHDGVYIVIKLSFSHRLRIINKASSIWLAKSLSFRSNQICLAFNKEVPKSILRTTKHKSLLRLGKDIHSRLMENIVYTLMISTSIPVNRILFITPSSLTDYTTPITNYGHCSFSFR